ncbi:dihydrofolate reductase family protein [Streptosporangium sp. NPDC000396]
MLRAGAGGEVLSEDGAVPVKATSSDDRNARSDARIQRFGDYATDEVAHAPEPFDARHHWSGSSRSTWSTSLSALGALEEVERSRRDTVVLSIDDDRRHGKFFKEIREEVSDRGGGVRSRGEAARKGRSQGQGAAIMKLTTMTQVTIDGVMQGNGAASDDRRNGFERGGWARGKGDDETRTFITQTYQRAEAFLFGRRTYELFAGSWGSIDQMRAHPIGVALNEAPKYVASTTLTAPRWEDTTVLRGDLAAAISELKAKPGGELQVHGSGILTQWLLENDLVDEMILIVIPVILGQGARLFPETGPDLALDLVESRVDSKGVTIQVYRPAGRPRYATA